MKKILTIVALTLVLCLAVSAALAASFGDLSAAQQKAIIASVLNAMPELKSSEGYESYIAKNVTLENGQWSFTIIAGEGEDVGPVAVAGGKVEGCKEGNHQTKTVYDYSFWDAAQKKVVEYTNKTAAEFAAINPDLASHFGTVTEKKVCELCNETVSTLVIVGKVDHDFANKYYLTSKPAEYYAPGTQIANVITEEEAEDWLCTAANKGKDLYTIEVCDCGLVKTISSAKATGAHTKGEPYEVWEPTCMDWGWKFYECTVCGAELPAERLATVDHSYVKVYSARADQLPNCQNGLTAYYLERCEWCGQYTDGTLTANWAKAIPEVVTAEKAADLNNWVIYSYGKDKVKNVDAAGHFYELIEGASGDGKYACQADYTWTLGCKCGAKLVVKNGEDNIKLVPKKVLKYYSCTDVEAELRCAVCDGKAGEGHIATDRITLKADDKMAHYTQAVGADKLAVLREDLSKHVEPTCIDAGQKVEVCSLCGAEVKTVLPKNGVHCYGKYEKDENGVYFAYCIVCGHKSDAKFTADDAKVDYWKFEKSVDGTCLAQGYELYKHYDKDGKVMKNADGSDQEKKVWTGYGDHIMIEVQKGIYPVAPTCSKEGVKLLVCVRCTTYNPDNKDAKVTDDYFTTIGQVKAYEFASIEKLPHTWGEAVVVPATAEKDGTSTKTCTVCGEVEVTPIPYVKGETKYTVDAPAYDKDTGLVSGKAVLDPTTVAPEEIHARVTYFLADQTFVVAISDIKADGTFKSIYAGECVFISVEIIDSYNIVPNTYTAYGRATLPVD